MEHEIDLKKYDIRTDLVLESIENNNSNIKTDVHEYGDIKVTNVDIDECNCKLINKKIGNYITIEFDDITDSGNCDNVKNVFVNELSNIINKLDIKYKSVLVVGLGNMYSTPDSLGPNVIDNIVVTRHLFLLDEEVSNGISCVSAISPGVTASTGIETASFVKSIVDDVKPDFVIVVDALAASSIDRINKSIQITDTGIHPGSGVGNMRKEISFDTVGIPVIAIGVPTVVESSIIVYDTLNYLFKHISYIKDNKGISKLSFGRNNYYNKIKDKELSIQDKKNFAGLLGELSNTDKKNLIDEVLCSLNYNFIVTPKEIDFQIDKLSKLIGNGINKCLHKEDV